MKRRTFLASASALAIMATSPAKAWLKGSVFVHGSMLMGLNGITQFGGFCPGINLVQWLGSLNLTLNMSDSTQITGAACFTGGWLDQYGNIVASTTGVRHVVSLNFQFWSPDADLITGLWTMDNSVWRISWTGNASASIGLLAAGGGPSNPSNGATFSFGSPQVDGVNVTWTVNDITNPPRNLAIWQDAYNTQFQAGQIFNPDWINIIKPFKTLRFMDWMGTNGSTIVNYSDIATSADTNWGTTSNFGLVNGPHSGVPISVICALANQTGCNIHFCIPHQATDACVTAIAQAFQAGTTRKVSYEYSNETWNNSFAQTAYCITQGTNSGFFPSLSGNRVGSAWSGYRAAQCMNIIRNVYNDASRWEGVPGCELKSSTTTVDTLTGINYFLTSTGSPLTANQLIAGAAVELYPGFLYYSRQITSVANDSVGTTICTAHGYSTGQKLRPFVTTGMTQINNITYTITVIDADTFQLNTNTTSFTAWSDPGGHAYVQDSSIYDLYDQSIANNGSNPTLYPSPYTYSNSQLGMLLTTGSCAYPFESIGITATNQIAGFMASRTTDLNGTGIQIRNYEASISCVSDTLGQGNTTLYNVLSNFAYSVPGAAIYTAMYAAYASGGGVQAAKFTECTQPTLNGQWGAVRWIPGNDNNPVYLAIRAANGA